MRDLDALWADPAHWSLFGYHCKSDPRVVVPKRNVGMGWTMNWSHPWAVPTIFGMMALVTIPTLGVVALAQSAAVNPAALVVVAGLATAFSVVALITLCKRLSNPR